MKNNKGVTLLEIIVSIAILGIAIVSTIQIMSTNNRLIIKNERGVNSIEEIESIMEIFSSDPEHFKENINSIYHVEEADYIRLYYSSAFIKNDDNSLTDYYLDIHYSKEIDTLTRYTLKIETFYNNELYTHSNSNYNYRVILK